ncbi:MAG: chemotaxis protein CheC [Candidatus Omnitrophica bacterium]|nr:chemotaxis protein CheC [Candidatus Omnitrophota bacterium]
MKDNLTFNQLDLLKEIGTIGAACAATALADLLGEKVEISVPQVSVVPLENLCTVMGGMERTFFVLDMEINGDILGRIFLLFSPDDAKFLGGTLLGKSKEEIDLKDELFQSSLKESANILCGSYVSSLAELTNMTILTGIPSLALDMVGAILDFIFIQIAQYSEQALYIKTDFKVKGLNLEGLFLFFPSTDSLQKIFEVLKLKE